MSALRAVHLRPTATGGFSARVWLRPTFVLFSTSIGSKTSSLNSTVLNSVFDCPATVGPSSSSPPPPLSSSSSPYASVFLYRTATIRSRGKGRTFITRASDNCPYETLELERDADEEKIKVAYRRLAKYYHPDVYDGRGTLEEGETAEARFIKIQAAYDLLIDEEKRREYDREHRVNPMKASQAWMDWLVKKRKAFDQRGDMAAAAWAEQQQREMFLRARKLARNKVDPEEERKILAREKKASMENFNNTLKRHTLVLKKRDLMRRKAEREKQQAIRLLAAEGLEVDLSEDDSDELE